jgi:hypothetical protein
MPVDYEYYGFEKDVCSMWTWPSCSVVVVQNTIGEIVMIEVHMEPADGD